MKKHFWKKAAALALVLSLFVSLLSVAAMAEEPGTDGGEPTQPPVVETTDGTDTEETEDTTSNGSQEPSTDLTEGPCTAGGEHEPDLSFQSPQDDYLPCRSGYTEPLYYCSKCYNLVTASGVDKDNVWKVATEAHKFGDIVPADYGPCGGGYHEDYRQCVVCGLVFDADGQKVLTRDPGTGGKHTPGGNLIRANYTPCLGGFKTEWYKCQNCSLPTDAEGNEIQAFLGDGTPHQIIGVPGRDATEEQAGWAAYWQCSVCHMSFANSEGTEYLFEDITVPALKEAKTESLNEVPDTISDQYATVDDVQTALLDAAGAAGFEPNQTNADSILLDITLQEKYADNTLVDVAPEDFPDEGVIVILPYPEGTDQSYTFVITHMITQGEKAGQTEVLWSVNTEDGIYVYFTSMSPMSISYMPQSSTSAPETPAPAPAAPVVSSTVPKTSDPAHGASWGMLALLSIGGLGALSIAGKKLRNF